MKIKKMVLIAISLALLVTLGAQAAQDEGMPIAQVILFHSPTCPHCRTVINEVLPSLQAEYGEQLELRLMDLTVPANYEIYLAIRQQNPDLPNAVPQLFISKRVLVGVDQIRNDLPKLIDDCLASGGCAWSVPLEESPAPEASATPAPQVLESAVEAEAVAKESPVYVAYFFDPSCLECERVQYDLKYLESQYPNLVVERFDILQEAALNEALCEHYGIPADKRLLTPAIFIGQQYLAGEEITVPHLKSLLDAPDSSLATPPWEGVEVDSGQATEQIIERFESFGLLAVAGAGLLDGVNPCAFTTMIFFVSYLALVGRKGREILLVGAAFTVAVFLTYLAMGLGLAEVVRQLGAITTIGRVIYGLTALICLVLAALSLWDYLKIRQGRLKEITLQLPKRLKKRIHHTIRTRSRMKGYIGAAFGAGVLVSVFELACTGQVYLPTIIFVAGVAELRLTALAYLILYNFMFVVPLIVVFMVTYWGTSSQKLTETFQTHAGAVKLLTALLFGFLGAWLAYMVLLT